MINKMTLENKVRVVCEHIPHVRSVSVGIWIATGSRNEILYNNGISHFVEHMVFKGTQKRSAKKIAESIDSIGGQLNAFTGRECTCFYTKTLDTHINIAIDVLADMFFNSKFSIKDIEIEKKVVLEELNMYQDSPEDLVHDLLYQTIWTDNSLGYPILGTVETINNFTREKIIDYTNENYIPDNIVISIAGNFDYSKLVKLLNKHFGQWKNNSKASNPYKQTEFSSNIKVQEKDTEQVHLCLGFNGVEHGNDEFYSLLAINDILGGGMSSKLFQRIREKKGLVYSIYSYPSAYKNTGVFAIYAGMNPEHLEQVSYLIDLEIKEFIKSGLSKSEIKRIREQLKGNYILGLESTSSRMNNIGKSELMLGRISSTEEIMSKIDAITFESVNEVMKKVFVPNKMCVAMVGNLKSNPYKM